MTRPAAEHGTRSRYQAGCDCASCCEANSRYQRLYRERTTPRLRIEHPSLDLDD